MKKIILNSMLAAFSFGIANAQISSSFIHKNNGKNTGTNYSIITNEKTDGKANLPLLVTHNSNPPGGKSLINDHKLGLFYLNGSWRVFNEDFTKMDTSLAFNILIPDADVKAWVHTADSALNLANTTVLDHALINGDSSAKIFISDIWNYNGKPGVYNKNPMGVYYDDKKKRWCIYNEDKTVQMVRNSSYSVVIPEKFSNITNFIHLSDVTNVISNTTLIDHISSNNNPNARIFVTHNWNPNGGAGKFHNHNVGVFYNGSKWAIFNEDLALMPKGVSFNVIIYTDKVSSIKKQDMNSKIHIFPNPVENGKNLEIEINNKLQGEIKIEVYDLMGKLWLTKSFMEDKKEWNEKLLIEGFAKGIYLLKVSNNIFNSTQRFVIE